MAKLQLKVSPKASRDAIGGWMGDTLKLSVTAVPERGKAKGPVNPTAIAATETVLAQGYVPARAVY